MASKLSVIAFMALASLGVSACATEDEDDGPEWTDGGKADGQQLLSYRTITTVAQFTGMALANGGVVIQGPSLKFVIDRRKPSSPKIYFQNANYKENGRTPEAARYHYYFSEAVLPDFEEDLASFNANTYDVQAKRYVAGTIQVYKTDANAAPVYGIQFYPEDVAKDATIVTAVTIVKSAFKIPNAKLAFVATGPQQTLTTTNKNKLIALGVGPTTIDQVLGSLKFLPLNIGEAWGYLRIFPPNSDDLTPLDIAVLDELPLDLAVVGGVITKAYQDASSHVNLKSKERGTPDMVLRDAGPTNTTLKPFANKPVHLIVKADGWKLEATTDAIIQAKFKERTNKPWTPVDFTPETRLMAFAEMCPLKPADCIPAQKKFGSKAANIGFLQHKQVLGRASDANTPSQRAGYDLVPAGIGVPVSYYHDFIAYAPNTTLRTKLSALIAAEKTGTLSPAQRGTMAAEVRAEFMKAQIPPATLTAIKAKLAATLPGIDKLKIRSSANAEDLPNFDGAGLHDSFAGRMATADNANFSCTVVAGGTGVETKLDVEPKTVQCALKGVWASLWNKRAIEERSFARLDHATVGMGIAIVAKYDLDSDEIANSVLVTRVINNEGLYGYSFSSQQGENLVTNPTPGTYSENVIAGFIGNGAPPTFTVLRYATPVAGQAKLTHKVLPDAQMVQMLDLTKAVETAYCKAKPGYYANSCDQVTVDPTKPTALDLELKILANGHLVFKQVREFAGH